MRANEKICVYEKVKIENDLKESTGHMTQKQAQSTNEEAAAGQKEMRVSHAQECVEKHHAPKDFSSKARPK